MEKNEGVDAEAFETDSPSKSESKSLIPKNGMFWKVKNQTLFKQLCVWIEVLKLKLSSYVTHSRNDFTCMFPFLLFDNDTMFSTSRFSFRFYRECMQVRKSSYEL